MFPHALLGTGHLLTPSIHSVEYCFQSASEGIILTMILILLLGEESSKCLLSLSISQIKKVKHQERKQFTVGLTETW